MIILTSNLTHHIGSKHPENVVQKEAAKEDAARHDIVEVQLDAIDLVKNEPLWALEFVGSSADLIALQKQIATDIARVFRTSITARNSWGPENPEAYPSFLQFLIHNQGSRPEETLKHLEEALSIDPNWASGWAELSWTYLRHGPWFQDYAYVDKAQKALDRAKSVSEEGRGSKPINTQKFKIL